MHHQHVLNQASAVLFDQRLTRGEASCQGGQEIEMNNCIKTHDKRLGEMEEVHIKRVRASKGVQYLSTIHLVLYSKTALEYIYTRFLNVQGKEVAL